MTENSLILIDEMCKHTNYYEGLSIAFSICKNILDYLLEAKVKNIHVIFATHFKELAFLQCCYSLVKTFHLDSKLEADENLKHTYKLERGVFKVENYGQKLVELSALPRPIIHDSKNMLNFFNFNLEVDFFNLILY